MPNWVATAGVRNVSGSGDLRRLIARREQPRQVRFPSASAWEDWDGETPDGPQGTLCSLTPWGEHSQTWELTCPGAAEDAAVPLASGASGPPSLPPPLPRP